MPTKISRLAQADLKQKLILERKLLVELRKFNKKLVRKFIRLYGTKGLIVDADDSLNELQAVLRKHYKRVKNKFDGTIQKRLPSNADVTNRERDIINSALNAYLAEKVPVQSQIINVTNKEDISSSVEKGRELTQAEPISQRELALVTGALLLRRLSSRTSAISATETQDMAEASKATEASVLSGTEPAVSRVPPGPVNVTKTWFTVGDNLVRSSPFDHVAANLQKRKLEEAFTVSGQSLRWPGDSSLGASAGNIINCRCSSIHDSDQIMAVRLNPGFEPLAST